MNPGPDWHFARGSRAGGRDVRGFWSGMARGVLIAVGLLVLGLPGSEGRGLSGVSGVSGLSAVAGGPSAPAVDEFYLRPGGVDTYLRPGGVDTYKRP